MFIIKKNFVIGIALLLTIAMITPVFGLGRREEIVDPTAQEEIEGTREGEVPTRDDIAEEARDEFVEGDEHERGPDGEILTRDEIFVESLEEESDQ
jgi:hypothetical protein